MSIYIYIYIYMYMWYISLYKCLATDGAKKRYQVCYTKHTAHMMTLGYRPEALRLESFHASGTKKTNCL